MEDEFHLGQEVVEDQREPVVPTQKPGQTPNFGNPSTNPAEQPESEENPDL